MNSGTQEPKRVSRGFCENYGYVGGYDGDILFVKDKGACVDCNQRRWVQCNEYSGRETRQIPKK